MIPPHPRAVNDAAPMSLGDALGLSVLALEPEVAKATTNSVHCRSLASVIETLLRDEPMLKATRNGSTVLVKVLGSDVTLKVSVTVG